LVLGGPVRTLGQASPLVFGRAPILLRHHQDEAVAYLMIESETLDVALLERRLKGMVAFYANEDRRLGSA
jgi:hypothetical protein